MESETLTGETTEQQEEGPKGSLTTAKMDDEAEEKEGMAVEKGEEEKADKVEEEKKQGKVGGRGGIKRGRTKGEGSKKSEGRDGEKKARKWRSSQQVEPATPLERPARARKSVERFSASVEKVSSVGKVLSIKKGRGALLKDIPNVAFKLSKRKADDNLQMLHTILFGKKTKKYNLKRNICQFSGFVWAENEEKQRAKVKEKLDKCVKEKLFDFCDTLDIPVNKATIKKEELSVKLLEFLESPHATTEVSLAEKEQKGKKRKGKAKGSMEKTSSEAPAEQSAKKLKKNAEVSDLKKVQKSSPKSKEKVEDEDESGPEGIKSSDEEEEKDEGEGEGEEEGLVKDEDSEGVEDESEGEEDMQAPEEKSMKGSKKPTKKGSGAKAKQVKKGSTAKPVKSTSKAYSKKVASSHEDDGLREEDNSHVDSESEEEKEQPKEHVESKKGSKRQLKVSASKTKEKATAISPAKLVKSPSKSISKKYTSVDGSVTGQPLPSKTKATGKTQQMAPIKGKKKVEKSDGASRRENKKQAAKPVLKASPNKQSGKGKAAAKVKPEPSRAEMLSVVTDILKEVDFNTATLSDILKQLGAHFKMDLMHRKVEVKGIIEEVINNMTDDEEGEEQNADEAEEDEEAGEDEDKDADV